MKRSLLLLTIPLITALAATIGGLFVFSHAARLPDGTPTLALDDSYIHLQYAWQTAQGHFLQYNTGDAPTTGATSLLYMLLLAGGFAFGISRQAMPGVVLIFGGILFVLTAALLSDLARRVADRAGLSPAWLAGLLAGLLFAGSGWMAWSFLSGMETGLLILLVTGTLWASVRRNAVLAAVLASLAALTRPEALILGVAVLAGEWLTRDPAERATRTRRLMWASMPLGATALSLALNYLLTGAAGSSGFQAKSLFTLVPFYPGQIARLIAGNAFELFVRLLGGPASDGRWHTLPLAQLLALPGVAALWLRGTAAAKRFALVCLGWILVGTAATTTLQTATWHHYRYQMPFYPSLLVLVSLLPSWLAAKMKDRADLPIGAGAVIVALIWSGYSLVDFGQAYALDTATIANMQAPLAAWINQNTPSDARIAAHDVGTLRYFGERSVVDVVGLTTPSMAESYRSGPGCLYEALEMSRPDYYAVYPDAAPPFFGIAGASDLLGEEVFRISPGSFSPYVSATGTQVVTRPDWSGIALADLPQQPDVLARLDGWTLVDRLDVAELGNATGVTGEVAHNYTWWNQGTPAGFPSDARKMPYRLDPSIALADGGRLMTGGETFTLKTKPGQPLLLVARLHQTVDMVLRVHVEGSDAGQWRLPAVPGEWLESVFPIPADFISKEQTQIAITIEEMFDAGSDTRYSPFHYWAYQGGNLSVDTPQPQNILQANFGDAIQLQGFDLSQTTLTPGDTLALTLHWQALNPPHANLRVFAHLVDPDRADVAEGIVAQADSAPRQGTYPFWVWQPHEVAADALLLAIPPDAPAGQYRLLVGIYDVATDQRLSIGGAADFGASRLMLSDVTVR
jgi:hypothetical protein